MSNKIVGVIICLLLISSTTTLALTPFSKDKQQIKHQYLDKKLDPLLKPKTWNKTFGGTNYDYGYEAQQTTDGGYIITAYTESYGAGLSDIWLIKTDSDGNKLWDKTFGGTEYDIGSSVQQTIDDGYIIAGYTESYGAGVSDVWLIKTDSDGNKLWDKTFGGTNYDYCFDAQQTTDGGYIITANTDSYRPEFFDIWLIKTDSNGNKLWDKIFGGTNNDQSFSVQQTSDGGYIITGFTGSYGVGGTDVWLIKTDDSGNKVWDKTFGGRQGDEGSSVQQTTDDGYIITGYTSSFGPLSYNMLLIKTDKNGEEQWNRTFGADGYDIGSSVQQTKDGGYIITGYSSDSAGLWLIKTDNNGNELWNNFIIIGDCAFTGYSVKQTNDGGYIITGEESYWYNYPDVFLIKTNSQGKSKTTLLDNLWFERLFQRFPNAFPLLRQLLGFNQ